MINKDAHRLCIAFELSLADGTLIDEAKIDDPLCFAPGDGTLAAPLEAHLAGLAPGECQVFDFGPGEIFAAHDPGNIHSIPKHDFPRDVPATAGLVVDFQSPGGESFPGTILDADGDEVMVDFNHPLAGCALRFSVEIISSD